MVVVFNAHVDETKKGGYQAKNIPTVDGFIEQFEDVFTARKSLPPKRSGHHKIPLLYGVGPGHSNLEISLLLEVGNWQTDKGNALCRSYKAVSQHIFCSNFIGKEKRQLMENVYRLKGTQSL